MPVLRHSAVLACCAALIAVGPLHSQTPAASVTILKDIPYLGPDRAEKMDAYLPPDRYSRPSPAILLIHGGGWKKGDKADRREREIGTQMAEAGYAVFSINYLLNVKEKPDGTGKLVRLAWPQNLYDCKSALRYLRQNSDKYGIAPAEIAVMGGSAGGSLAMLVGVTADVAELNGGGLYLDQNNAVKCIVDLYGIPDITGQWMHSFTGPTKVDTEKNSHTASPSTYFKKEMPPILIAHGTADVVVPVQISRDLTAKLKDLGVDCTYVEIPDAPHTFGLQTSGVDLRPALTSFLQSHLQKPALK